MLYDRVNRTAYLPDGTVERFDGNNDLISSTDPFGNAISLERDSANKKVYVTQSIGSNEARVVTLTCTNTDLRFLS